MMSIKIQGDKCWRERSNLIKDTEIVSIDSLPYTPFISVHRRHLLLFNCEHIFGVADDFADISYSNELINTCTYSKDDLVLRISLVVLTATLGFLD